MRYEWKNNTPQARRKTVLFASMVAVVLAVLFWPSGKPRQKRVSAPPAPLARRRVPKPAPEQARAVLVANPAATPPTFTPAPVVEARVYPAVPPVVTPAPLPEFHPATPEASVVRQETGPPVYAAPPVPSALAGLAGMYFGRLALAHRGSCTFRLEVKHEAGQETFTGYSTLACFPSPQQLTARYGGDKARVAEALERARNPTSVILTGKAEGNALRLNAVQNVGVRETQDGCDIVSLSLSAFGGTQAAVEWREAQQGICQGGQMVLTKIGR